MIRISHYALAFILLAIFMNSVGAETPIVIKFSHVSAADSPKGLAVSHFKKLVEKKTNKRVRIDIYPDGQLYEDNVALEALQLGAIQMLIPSISKISTLGLHEFEVFDLPYLFPSKEALYRITEGPIGQDLLDKLETKGIVGLGFWDNGFKSMFSNKPIHAPTDMRGLKIRTDPSGVLAQQMKILGAIPVHMTFPDLVQSMQQNVIDGVENTPSNFYLPGIANIPQYLLVTDHGYLGYAVLINKKFWNTLPLDIREQLKNAVHETTGYANVITERQNAADLAAIKKSAKTTVYEPTNAEKIVWRNALHPVAHQMEQRIGKKLINAVNQTIDSSDN
jgi:C4-dicarboxylate-binding protein DctP